MFIFVVVFVFRYHQYCSYVMCNFHCNFHCNSHCLWTFCPCVLQEEQKFKTYLCSRPEVFSNKTQIFKFFTRIFPIILNFNLNLNLICVSTKSVIQHPGRGGVTIWSQFFWLSDLNNLAAQLRSLLLKFHYLCICSSTSFCRKLCLHRQPSDCLNN